MEEIINVDNEVGKYHKHNYLKYLIFKELYDVYPTSLTVPEIAERINIPKRFIDVALRGYLKYEYIGRRKGNNDKKGKHHARKIWKYRLNLLGISTYVNLLGLHNQGRELNLRKKQRGTVPEKIDSYLGYSERKIMEHQKRLEESNQNLFKETKECDM